MKKHEHRFILLPNGVWRWCEDEACGAVAHADYCTGQPCTCGLATELAMQERAQTAAVA